MKGFYDCVLLDFDGTVADSQLDVWVSIDYAAQLMQLHIPEKVRQDPAILGKPLLEIYGMLEPSPNRADFQKFDDMVTLHYRQMNEFQNTHLYEGMEELLLFLKAQKVKRTIITNKPLEALERIILNKNWCNLFDGWYCPDSLQKVPMKKVELLEKLKCANLVGFHPIMVGDTFSDIVAAKKNQIDSIGVLYGDGDAESILAEKPTYVVHDVHEIYRILGGLNHVKGL